MCVRFAHMKLLASILASIFLIQVSTPVWCATGCDDSVVKHLRQTAIVSCELSGNCCMMKTEVLCEETISASKEKNAGEQPCADSKNCCTPCCALPLITCSCEESGIFNFTSQPVTIAGQLPSSNGIPHAGFRADCFQPPEVN